MHTAGQSTRVGAPRQILDHYYGGTTSAAIDANSRIRVRLTGLDGAGTVGVISHGSGVIWNGQTHASIQARRNGATFDIFASSSIACNTALGVPDGPVLKGATGDAVRQIQQFLTQFGFNPGGVDGDFGNLTEQAVIRFQASRGLGQDGQWRAEEAAAARAMIGGGSAATFTYIGTTTTPRFETAPGESATTALGLCEPDGTVTHYRGILDAINDAGTTRVVNDVRVEDYLRGVVPKEISASWAVAGSGRGAEAVAAQAVAARSYGLEQRRYSYASTCDTQACQVYAGSATRTIATGAATLVEDFRTDQAIAATDRHRADVEQHRQHRVDRVLRLERAAHRRGSVHAARRCAGRLDLGEPEPPLDPGPRRRRARRPVRHRHTHLGDDGRGAVERQPAVRRDLVQRHRAHRDRRDPTHRGLDVPRHPRPAVAGLRRPRDHPGLGRRRTSP